MLKKITIATLSAILLQSSAMGAASHFLRATGSPFLRVTTSLITQTGHPFSHTAPTFTHEESHQKGSWRSWGTRFTGAATLFGLGIWSYKNDKLPQFNKDCTEDVKSALTSSIPSVSNHLRTNCPDEDLKKFESAIRALYGQYPASSSYFRINARDEYSHPHISDKTLNWMVSMVRNYPELDGFKKILYPTAEFSLEDFLTSTLKTRKDNLYNKKVIPPIPSQDGGFYLIDEWSRIKRFDSEDQPYPEDYYTLGLDIFYGTEIKGIFYVLTEDGLIYPFEAYKTGKYLGSDFFEEFAANIQDPNIRTIIESYWKIAYCNWKQFDIAEKNDALEKLKELLPEYPIFRNDRINYYLKKFPNGLYQPRKLADGVFELNGYIVHFMPDGSFYLEHDDDFGYILYSPQGQPLREASKDEVVLNIKENPALKRVIEDPAGITFEMKDYGETIVFYSQSAKIFECPRTEHAQHNEFLYCIKNEDKTNTSDSSLIALNLCTQELIWTHKVPWGTRLQLSENGRTVFTRCWKIYDRGNDRTRAFDAQTGKELWSVKLGPCYMHPSACGKYLYCIQDDNLSRITVATGEHEELGKLDYKYNKRAHSLPDGKVFISHLGRWHFLDFGFPNPYPLGV